MKGVSDMNADRIKLVFDNYVAHFADHTATPAEDKIRASAHCRAHFDLTAPDLAAMLREAFREAMPIVNYAGSVQPLCGLIALAEQDADFLREALTALVAPDHGDLDARQARMQHFAERCNEKLHLFAPTKRSWEQNLRSGMAVRALLNPADDHLYKSTEARSFADMIGFGLDVTAGSAFRMSNYYALCDALVQVLRRHEPLMALLPDADDGQLHLVIYDVMLNAPAAKWGLFGALQPVIRSRSRAGQANQERTARISRMQMEITLMRGKYDALGRQIADLPEIDMVGKQFRSTAFGQVTAIRQESGRLTILAGNAEKKMALPMSILQGFLIPEDAAIRERYEQERQLLGQRRALESDIRNRESEMHRLEAKP